MMTAISFSKHFRSPRSYPQRGCFRGVAVSSIPSKTTGPIYGRHKGVEDLEMYCEGGYHPTRLGDEFSRGRYRVVHKLGYGSFSTVWMARDYTEERYVSLKVITAAASMSSSEAKIRDHLRRSNLDHPDRSFVSSLLDDFWIDGPNGRHQCLVNELVGSTLLEAKEASKTGMLPLEVGRAITPQLALGLDYIHSHGILHGGQSLFSSLQISPVLDLLSLQDDRSSHYEHLIQTSRYRCLDYRVDS